MEIGPWGSGVGVVLELGAAVGLAGGVVAAERFADFCEVVVLFVVADWKREKGGTEWGWEMPFRLAVSTGSRP